MADYEVSRFEHAITTRIHNKLKDVDSWAEFVDDDNTLAVALHSLSEGYDVTHVRDTYGTPNYCSTGSCECGAVTYVLSNGVLFTELDVDLADIVKEITQ